MKKKNNPKMRCPVCGCPRLVNNKMTGKLECTTCGYKERQIEIKW